MDDVTAYPLTWPAHIPRTKYRSRARFGQKERVQSAVTPGHSWLRSTSMTVASAIERLQGELGRFQATRLVVSTNVPVRRDGLPYSQRAEPADPGVAVYFRLKKRPYCLPCDRWDRVGDNIAAIAAHVAALRGIERWGVGTVEQAFTGYLALPDPSVIDWRAEFPHVTSLEGLEAAYRARAKALHPDTDNGDHEAMVRLNQARDAARVALQAGGD